MRRSLALAVVLTVMPVGAGFATHLGQTVRYGNQPTVTYLLPPTDTDVPNDALISACEGIPQDVDAECDRVKLDRFYWPSR